RPAHARRLGERRVEGEREADRRRREAEEEEGPALVAARDPAIGEPPDDRVDAPVEEARDEEGEPDERRGEEQLAARRLLIAVLERPREEEADQRHDAELPAEEEDALARRHGPRG